MSMIIDHGPFTIMTKIVSSRPIFGGPVSYWLVSAMARSIVSRRSDGLAENRYCRWQQGKEVIIHSTFAGEACLRSPQKSLNHYRHILAGIEHMSKQLDEARSNYKYHAGKECIEREAPIQIDAHFPQASRQHQAICCMEHQARRRSE